MKYRVQLVSRAQNNVRQILNWISQQSVQGANHWLDEFEAALLSLEDDPERCPLAVESARGSHEIRELSFQTARGRRYRLLFTIVFDHVRILCVRSPGQDLASQDDLN